MSYRYLTIIFFQVTCYILFMKTLLSIGTHLYFINYIIQVKITVGIRLTIFQKRPRYEKYI